MTFQLDQGAETGLAGEIASTHRLVRGVAARGIGQERVALGVDVVEERLALPRQAHAAYRHGDDLRAGRLDGLAHVLERGILPRPHDEPGLELFAAEPQ
jgi:hypothetical protein